MSDRTANRTSKCESGIQGNTAELPGIFRCCYLLEGVQFNGASTRWRRISCHCVGSDRMLLQNSRSAGSKVIVSAMELGLLCLSTRKHLSKLFSLIREIPELAE